MKGEPKVDLPKYNQLASGKGAKAVTMEQRVLSKMVLGQLNTNRQISGAKHKPYTLHKMNSKGIPHVSVKH